MTSDAISLSANQLYNKADSRRTLQARFAPGVRDNNFGTCIMSIHVRGIRNHINTKVRISSPITALCGLNGTGKTTLLQLAAVAFSSPDLEIHRNYTVKDFFVSGKLDPMPFQDAARIDYEYSNGRRVTIAKNKNLWTNYKNRPTRNVAFAGIGLFLPQTERRDSTVHHAKSLLLSDSSEVAERVQTWTEYILERSYDYIKKNDLIRKYSVHGEDRSARLSVYSVGEGPVHYSEVHMGYGEGRILSMVAGIEELPKNSLILIEEPETSLHYAAQARLGDYLVASALHNGHQFFITTHSDYILERFPPESRIYLERTKDSTNVLYGLTTRQVRSLMSEGRHQALSIFVEDNVAQALVYELIRTVDPILVRTVRCHYVKGGGVSNLLSAVTYLQSAGFPIAVILDGDQSETIQDFSRKLENKILVRALPGTRAPEEEVLKSPAVQDHLSSVYGILWSNLWPRLRRSDKHTWFASIAHGVNVSVEHLITQAAQIYARNLTPHDSRYVSELVGELREKTHQ